MNDVTGILKHTIPTMIGKSRRLHRLFSATGKSVIVPLDDSLISYSHEGLIPLRNKVENIQSASPNGILCYQGTASLVSDYRIPLIYNVTASTTNSTHTNKVLISNVEDALQCDASAVAVHLNVSSKYESNMLEIVGKVSSDCQRYGMPLLVIVYPRKEASSNDDNYEEMKLNQPDEYARLVSHCVRIAFELGADIIKTQYTGSSESFREVVAAAVNKPVLIAGGKFLNEEILYDVVRGSIAAGGAGVSIGRNVFNRNNSNEIIANIKNIVFAGKTEDIND